MNLLAFFICASLASTYDVAYKGNDLVYGISPLPSDCHWTTELDNYSRSINTNQLVDQITVGGVHIGIGNIHLNNGMSGFSAGYVPLVG